MLPFSKRVVALALVGSCLAAAPGNAAPKKKAPATDDQAAQPAAQPAPTTAAADGSQNNKLGLLPTQKDWTKVCGKDQTANKEVCYTTRDFSAEVGKPPVLALAVYDIKGDDTKIVRMLMPIGLMLRPGFRFVVDNGQPTEGAYEICFPTAASPKPR